MGFWYTDLALFEIYEGTLVKENIQVDIPSTAHLSKSFQRSLWMSPVWGKNEVHISWDKELGGVHRAQPGIPCNWWALFLLEYSRKGANHFFDAITALRLKSLLAQCDLILKFISLNIFLFYWNLSIFGFSHILL